MTCINHEVSSYTIIRELSKSFRTQSIKKYTLTTINTRSEATRRVMAATLTRMTHKIAIQLHLVAESCTISSSRSKRPVRKFLDTPSFSKQFTVQIFSSQLCFQSITTSDCSEIKTPNLPTADMKQLTNNTLLGQPII
jgi:hypothetical protein